MLHLDSPLTAHVARQNVRLNTFITSANSLALAACVLYIIGGFLFHQPIMFMLAAWCLAIVGMGTWCKTLIKRGQPAQAALSLGLGMIIIGVTLILILHTTWINLLLILLIGLMLALPYLDSRQARWMMTATVGGVVQ